MGLGGEGRTEGERSRWERYGGREGQVQRKGGCLTKVDSGCKEVIKGVWVSEGSRRTDKREVINEKKDIEKWGGEVGTRGER